MGTGTALLQWLDRRLPPDTMAWLRERCGALAAGAPDKDLFLAFSAASRHTGKDELGLTAPELTEAGGLRDGWDPRSWTADQAGRIALLLHLPHDDEARYLAALDRLFGAADLGEQVALHKALPLLAFPEAHRARCAEGIRTNITDVFTAVAHFNPYPAEQLDEIGWHQVVLKALFVGVPLDPIVGLDRRATPQLARMLCDYAHERWSAHRPVSPELWRCVGPHADEAMLGDLERVLRDEEDTASQRAATLALRACPHPGAAALLASYPVDLPDSFDWSQLA
ncbi:MAG: EboA domain-containing protein [Planctomycetota bacterium]